MLRKKESGPLLKPGKKAKKAKASGPKEKDIQRAVEDYLNLKHIKYFRIPDTLYKTLCGIYSKTPIHIRKMAADAFKGVPDLMIFDKAGQYNSCLMIELKKKGGSVTQGQRNWHKGVNVAVCYGTMEAIGVINVWLSSRDTETGF